MSKVTIQDMDLGMKKIFQDLEADAKYVDIGVHSDESEQLLIIASANEFGTERGIPARSYIRSTVDNLEDKYAREIERLANHLIEGRYSKFQALSILGQIVEGDIKTKIINLKEPPNDPSTIKKKGSENPLVDTGLLGQSIRYIVKT